MRVTITRQSESGQLVTFNIYPTVGSQKMHDVVIIKHYPDKTMQIRRYIIGDENCVADLLYMFFMREEAPTHGILDWNNLIQIVISYEEFLHDTPKQQ